MSKGNRTTLLVLVCSILIAMIYAQITLFIIPPIGALPEGKTIVILSLNKTKFIDSPDAMCERLNGGVSLLCRGVMMAGVVNKSIILFRLPYSESLYLISTGGKTYNN